MNAVERYAAVALVLGLTCYAATSQPGGYNAAGPAQEPPRTRVPQPAAAGAAWDYILGCTRAIGLLPTAGKNLADVKWYTAKLEHTRRSYVMGLFYWPDTVVVDERMTGEAPVLAHELLHYLLRIDPSDGEPSESHPYVPFYAPCGLMAHQTTSIDTVTGVLTFKQSGLRLYPRTLEPPTPTPLLLQWPDGLTVYRARP